MQVGGAQLDDTNTRARGALDRANQARVRQAQEAAAAASRSAGRDGEQARPPVDDVKKDAARQAAHEHRPACRQYEPPADPAAPAAQATRPEPARRNARNLRRGSSGEDVRALQQQLNARGARVPENGRFDRRTERAVIREQQRARIAKDGVVGPDTRQALERGAGRVAPGAGQPGVRQPGVQPSGGDVASGRRTQGTGAVQPGTPGDTSTVRGAAQFLLNSPNVKFWNGLSTGSDRKNLERLARGERAMVDAKGRSVDVNPRMMQALVAMAKAGPIQINALTGGVHSHNSRHYSGHAVDLATQVGNARQIENIARQYGGRRNNERTHIHLSF